MTDAEMSDVNGKKEATKMVRFDSTTCWERVPQTQDARGYYQSQTGL